MSAPNNNLITELMVAASRGDLARVEALLRGGADVNARDAFGQTALIYAAGAGHRAVAGELIDGGADVDARDRNNMTAFELADERGHSALAALLRSARLFPAARDGGVAGLEALLDSGVDPNTLLRDEWTALMIAERKGHAEVARRLSSGRAEKPLPALVRQATPADPSRGADVDLADFPDHVRN